MRKVQNTRNIEVKEFTQPARSHHLDSYPKKWRLNIFRFENGMVAVCGDNGKQMADLQGTAESAIPKIIEWLKENG